MSIFLYVLKEVNVCVLNAFELSVKKTGTCNQKVGHPWFRPFWLRLSGPGPQQHQVFFSSYFSIETRLNSEAFEPLTSFLWFLVQKLG